MKNNKPVTVKPDIGPVRPGKNPYNNDIPEYEIPTVTDDVPLPSDLPLVDDPDIPIQEE